MSPERIRPIQTPADVTEILEQSHRLPAVLFKHSTSCGISHYALKQFHRFLDDHDGLAAGVALVRVIEERPLSRLLAERLGVIHHSPQVIVIRDGRAVWHASHTRITAEELAQAAQKHLSAS